MCRVTDNSHVTGTVTVRLGADPRLRSQLRPGAFKSESPPLPSLFAIAKALLVWLSILKGRERAVVTVPVELEVLLRQPRCRRTRLVRLDIKHHRVVVASHRGVQVRD